MWGHLRVGESQSPCKATPVYRRNCPRMRGVRAGLGAETSFYSTGNTRPGGWRGVEAWDSRISP